MTEKKPILCYNKFLVNCPQTGLLYSYTANFFIINNSYK